MTYGPEEFMVSDFFPPVKLEAWIRTDRKAPLQDFVTPEYKETRDCIFAKDDA